MFKFGKARNEKKDMQADNFYLRESLGETDWNTLKNSDILILTIIETASQNQFSKALLASMVERGFDTEGVKEKIEKRISIRKRIVGDKDITNRKTEFKDNKEELSKLKIEMDFYKSMVEAHGDRPYSEVEFKAKSDRRKELEDWIYENRWIANHEAK